MGGIENLVKGLARSFTATVPTFSLFSGLFLRNKFGIFLGIFLFCCDFINKLVKLLFNKIYFKSITDNIERNNINWLKKIIGEGTRPDGAKLCGSFINESDINTGGLSTSFGMPSGHSQMAITAVFMLSMYLSNLYSGDAWCIISIFIICLLGFGILFSRWYLGCHRIGQIVIGGIIGLIYGSIGWSIFKSVDNDDSYKGISIASLVMILIVISVIILYNYIMNKIKKK